MGERRGALVMSGPSLVILAAGRARRYGGIKQLAPVGKVDAPPQQMGRRLVCTLSPK